MESLNFASKYRALDLDSLEAQPGHVITGVRLRDLGGHLNLEVRCENSFTYGRLFYGTLMLLGRSHSDFILRRPFGDRKLSLDRERYHSSHQSSKVWYNNLLEFFVIRHRFHFIFRTELLIVNPDVSSKTSAPSRMLGSRVTHILINLASQNDLISCVTGVDGKFVQFDSTSPEKDVSSAWIT